MSHHPLPPRTPRFAWPSFFRWGVIALVGLAACNDDGPGVAPAEDTTVTTDTLVPDIGLPDTGSDDAATPGDTATGPVPLQINRITPAKGLAIGLEQIEVEGTGFRGSLQVFFGESLAQDIFVLNSERLVLLTPPRPPGLVDVRVVDVDTGEQAVLEKGFLYFNPIAVQSVEADRGTILGGERVTIRGYGFRAESIVFFGQRQALSVEIIDDTTIRALTPAARVPGTVDVHVSNDLGFGTLDDGFRYVAAPRIEAVVPPVGPIAGGTQVEIRGAGFEEPLTLRIGEAQLNAVEVLSSTRIRAVTGPVATEGPRDVVVTTAEGTGALGGGFTYLQDLNPQAPLALLGLTPSSGRPQGRESVTLIARGLGTTQNTTVTFGGRQATVRAVDAAQFLVVVDTPSGTGTVDVTLNSNGQSSTLPAAFRYRDEVRVDSVTPATGPTAGNAAITVRGAGFRAGLELRVGALVASQVRVIDATTIEALTPPGAPGLVDVVVIQQGSVYRLDDAYTYEGPFELHLIDPPRGSQAGGTVVQLIGSGFPADARVRFGTRFATHVEVRSETLITCRTPPGDLGTVPVTVLSDSEGERFIADAFTYFDPTTNFGGTWGGPIEGDVNVTVVDGSTGAPIPDAFVMLWTDPRTPYQGFTDARGQVTFSGPDLMGEQMVSASKNGYTRASVVEYDAKNVTVYLVPTTPPSPGEPPEPPPVPTYRGVVRNLGKAVPVPIGRCSSFPDAPGTLCDTCASDDACGSNSRCSMLPDQLPGGESASFCTRTCAAQSQCPTGFNCLPVNGATAMQCLPSAGTVTAFCDVTNTAPTPFARDFIPDPGIQVNADMSFEIPVPFGEFAVYCWGGVLDTAGAFRRYALGVDRFRFANPGDRLTGEVELRHPLNKTYRFALDAIPRGPDGPDIEALWSNLNLGSEGYISFAEIIEQGATSFTVENFLGTPAGDIAGATFSFIAGSFSFFTNSQTLTFHQGLPSLDNDIMFFGVDGTWDARRSGITQNINGLWRTADSTVGVGSEGLIVRRIGNTWARQASGVNRHLRAVHGAGAGGAGELVAVGDGGAITRWDGLRWNLDATPTTQDLLGVWLASATEGFAVGNSVMLHYREGTWQTVTGVQARRMNGVWGFNSNDVWAVGNNGTALRWNGSAWNALPTNTSLALRGVWGSGPNDVWVVGEGGIVLRWNGLEFQRVQLGTTGTISKVWGTAADRVYLLGNRGQAWVWNGATVAPLNLGPAAKDLDLLAIGGTANDLIVTALNELVLGPILPIPENLRPGQAQIMANDYRLSWRAQPGTLPHFHYVEVAIPTMFGPEPEWTIVADYDVDTILLPDFPSIEGTPGVTAGAKILTVMRVFKEGFDIDNHSNSDMSLWGWKSWSMQSVDFTKL
jgi:hypothetical protein